MTAPLSPAVLAEDLRALADGPFDAATRAVLEQAADRLDGGQPEPTGPTYPGRGAITNAVEVALDSSLIEITATQDGQPAELWQVVRCLDRNGLIDWRDIQPVPELAEEWRVGETP